MIKEIKSCRICGNSHLTPVLDLGVQALTGVFPRSPNEPVTKGPLELVKCSEDKNNGCGLLQLRHSYEANEMYGENYGYRSGLNRSMVEHLGARVKKILEHVQLKADDLIIDIGSNDSTLLQAYPDSRLRLVGIDPTGVKFKKYYPKHIELIPDFFSAAVVRKHLGHTKAKVISSIAMFYDLESPTDFMRGIIEALDDEGIWVFEQSYMPTMIKTNSFDTICHEHLEYYALKQIKWMVDKVGLKIIDVEFNDINGGSFAVTVAKRGSRYREAADLGEVLARERSAGFDDLQPYVEFSKNIDRTKKELLSFIHKVRSEGKKIYGLGASTKGNVILQYCGITEKDIPFVGEVNAEKFGAYTPGTLIPIISEADLLAKGPDYLLVLPWHFKDFFLKTPKFKNVKLVFPLPQLEVV